MTIFKGYLKVIKSMMGLIVIYAVIFFGITFAMQKTVAGTEVEVYQATGLKIGIVDQDQSVMSKGLSEYLKQYHTVIPLENHKSEMQEKLYYADVEYIVQIPSNFTAKCIRGEESLSVTKIPGSYKGTYVDQQINSFLNHAKIYAAAGSSENETVEAVLSAEKAEVAMLDTRGNGGVIPDYIYYFRYVPYLFISLFGYAIGNVLIAMKKSDIQKRMRASAISTQKQSLQGVMAISCLGILVWMIVLSFSMFMYGNTLWDSGKMCYVIFNTFAMLFVAIGMSYMVGCCVSNMNALNGIVTVLGLGMSFLCGVFVDMNLLSKGVRYVAQFLPVYWYEVANELLGQYEVFPPQIQADIWKSIGIQMVFAMALFCVGLVVTRMRRQEE